MDMGGRYTFSLLCAARQLVVASLLASCGGGSDETNRETPLNTPPTITGTSTAMVLAGEEYAFTPTAYDADDDSLTFGITGQPPWTSFDAATGALQGIPSETDQGVHAEIRISVSDGKDSTSLPQFSVTVEIPNSAPTISGSPTTSVLAGQKYTFLPVAFDPDDDALVFDITGQPSWADFDPDSGLLEGTPTETDVGIHAGIVIFASDGEYSSALPTFSISVQPAGPRPSASGLDTRPSNATCAAVDAPDSAEISLQRVFPDMTWGGGNLTVLTQAPTVDDAWYFATREGLIGRFANTATASSFTTVLDLTGTIAVADDGGLIQLVFHPNFPSDNRVFVNYSVPPSDPMLTADVIVSSFEVSPDGMTIDPLSEIELVRYSRGRFHQGGFMTFALDGTLLIGFGDGTEQKDPTGAAQNLSDLRGKVIRIDVDSGSPYSIPADNPFIDDPVALDEIYALGLRNPYRGDVDPDTGRIYVADVGFNRREEISELFNGANLGWNMKEGTICRSEEFGSCSDPALIDPLVEYSHDDGNCAIIGGYFYRGQAIPQLQGKYVFADFCTAKISAVDFDDDGNPFELSLVPAGTGFGMINTFARDNAGELYAASSSQIQKIQPGSPSTTSGPATQLSQTGCFDVSDPASPAEGVIPYDLRAPLWSDGATKRRWMALPDGATIDLDPDGDFLFPAGTVLAKEFSVDGSPVETRLLMKDSNSVWMGYSYEWIGNDAFLLPAGKEKVLSNGQIWSFPDRGECLRCHNGDSNFALGPEIGQLNGDLVYEQTNRISNQLATLEHIGMFTNGLPNTPDQLTAYAGLDEGHQAVSRRARSYLHSNCSGCHRGEGPTQSNMDLRFSASRTGMNVCNVDPRFGDIGIIGAKLVTPGQPELSVLANRPARTDPLERMPPLGTVLVDDAAIAVLTEWIRSPEVCDIESDGDLDSVPDDADNCPAASNPDQADSDEDGMGDVCDTG